MADAIDRVFRLPKSDELPWYTAADLVRSGFAEYYRGQKKPQILNTMMSPAANKGHSPAKFIPTEAGLLVSRTGIGTFLWEQAVFPSLKPAWDVLGGGNVLLAVLLETRAEHAREDHEVRKTVAEINRKFASIPFARIHGVIWRQSGSWWNFASRLTLVYDDEGGARQQIGLMSDKFYPNLLSFLFENRCDLEGALDFRRELASHVKVVLDRLGVTVLRADGPDDAKVNLVNQELASYWRKNGLTIDDIRSARSRDSTRAGPATTTTRISIRPA